MTQRSVSQAHGPGAMFHEPGAAPNVGWAFMFSLTAILGAWGGGTLGQSDWTRYATKQMAPVPSQLIASPLTITVTAVIGIVVTSAARDVLGGDVIWNPIYLLAAMQEYYGSNSGVRAGVFFGGLGLVASQLAVRNGCHGRVAIGLCTGLTGFDPSRFPSCSTPCLAAWTWQAFGRGTSTFDAEPPSWPSLALPSSTLPLLLTLFYTSWLLIRHRPWQLLATAAKFLQVLSGFGVFLAPLT